VEEEEGGRDLGEGREGEGVNASKSWRGKNGCCQRFISVVM
jgi:hypothetical protein